MKSSLILLSFFVTSSYQPNAQIEHYPVKDHGGTGAFIFARSKVIETSELRILDSSKRVRMVMSAKDDTDVSLRMLAPDGRQMLSMSMVADQNFVIVQHYGPNGELYTIIGPGYGKFGDKVINGFVGEVSEEDISRSISCND